jgi:iron complex outermembrane receptor protein
VYCVHTPAQTFSISGKIADSLNNPLGRVNVSLVGKDFGVSSDEMGRYEFTNLLPGIYSLEFSYIGYSKLRLDSLTINNESITIDVILIAAPIESEEVIITAGKYEQKKSDLPVSSEIITDEVFTKKNFSNLEDALRYVPGVNMTEDQISIRGSGGYSRGAGSRSLLAIDGLTFYTGDTGETVWEMIPVTELSRVEIIKGAASSLYGSSAIGGVINGLTKEISGNPVTTLNGFYGFYDKPYYSEWDWSGENRPFNGLTLSHSNSFGKFGFNVALTRLEDLSYRRDDDFKKYIGFLKAAYNFSPSSSVTLLANTFNKRAGNFLYWKNSRNALVPPDINVNQRVETNRYFIGAIYKNVFNNNFFMNAKTSYYYNNFEDNGTPSNESTSNLWRGEVQFTSGLSDLMIITTGIEASTSFVKSNLFGNPDAYSFGLYAASDVNFSFPLIVSLGIRYDFSKPDSLDGAGAISPKLGLNYKLFNNLIFRTSLGTGFRAPTLAEAFTSTSASGITVKPNPGILPESNLTFEIGVSYLPIAVLNLDFAVFNNEYYEMIEAGIDPADGLVVFDNITRARIQGLEAGTIMKLFSDVLSFTFNYTYLWARDLTEQKSLKYRPRHLFYSGFDFESWNIELGADFRYWSKVEEIDEELVELGIVADGDLRVPVYITDLRAGYNFFSLGLPLKVFVNVKNLLNYNYVELIGNLRQIRSYSFGINLVL